MDDKLEEQTRMLLKQGLGDTRVLEQIHRAVLHGEIVSNNERNYVQSLVDKHEAEITPAPPETTPPSPAKEETAPKQSSTNNNTKLILIAVAGVAAVVAVAALALIPAPPSPNYGIWAASDTYSSGDFIEIEGTTNPALGDTLTIRILDDYENVVWSDTQVIVDGEGSYHTLALAGGSEWIPGTYMIESVHGDSVFKYEFQFD